MIANRSSRHRARLVAASALLTGVVTMAVMSACGTGQITQTANQVPPVAGVNANAGPNGEIALRDVLIAYNTSQGYPQGGSAPLVVRIFNNGHQAVKLVSVTAADAADSVALVASSATPQAPATSTAPSPTPAASGSAGPSGSASPAGSPAPSGSATPSAAPVPSPSPSQPTAPSRLSISIPASSYVLLVPGQGQYLQLTGLKRPLGPGSAVPVTFTFDDGSTVTVSIPFGLPTAPLPRESAAVSGGHGEE
ncbi:MAG TPA: copper chaperone PCu(A)C [Micromonosporaceae bacterium]